MADDDPTPRRPIANRLARALRQIGGERLPGAADVQAQLGAIVAAVGDVEDELRALKLDQYAASSARDRLRHRLEWLAARVEEIEIDASDDRKRLDRIERTPLGTCGPPAVPEEGEDDGRGG